MNTETKFTKGPLKASGIHIMKEGITGRIGQAFLITVPSYDNKFAPDLEAEANARLWAMAPELYETLETIVNNIDPKGHSEPFKKAIELLNRINS